MSPCEGEAGAEPGDDEHEDAGQQHLGRVERRLVAGDPVADRAHRLRLAGIPAQEGVLAADAAQHAQPRDGVGAQPDQPAGLLALCGCRACSGRTMRLRRRDEHRHADEHDEPEGRATCAGG